MDSSSLQLHQEIMDSQSLDSMLMCTKSESDQQQQLQQEKKPRPADEQALKCPRCDSSNTKFCYYNNYSLTQPRYFCKSCRRYWTKGGILRNVPVGGGCRKNKRCSSASRRSNTPDHLHSLITSPTSSSQHLISPLTSYDHHHNNNNAHDLTLAFAHHHQNGNIPILGNSGNTHFDLFGNHFTGNLLDSLRSGLVHHDHNNNNNNNNNNINNGLHLYYGGNLENVENGEGNVVNDLSHEDHHQHQQMGMHFDLLHHQNHNHHQQDIMSNGSSGASTPTIKQELGDHNGPSSVLLNYIMNGGGGDQMDHHHAPRESWNTGVLGSSWHNLLHSPLM